MTLKDYLILKGLLMAAAIVAGALIVVEFV